MILSMTGFGDAQREDAGRAYHVELRCVNNRYFKASISLPNELLYLEADIERRLRQRITRGSVHVRLFVRDTSGSAAPEINAAVIAGYVQQLRQAAGGGADLHIDLAALAALPGVIASRELDERQREEIRGIVEALLDAAVERLVASRSAEGRVLTADLRRHCAMIRERLELVRGRVPLVVQEYAQRLLTRANELLATSSLQLSQEGLQREVALYADRSDISEEISRLGGHLEAFDAALGSGEPSGRRLDFVVQEMLREANTMGAKSGDPEIARCIIDIKSAIDRLKEQVQNAE